MDKVTLNGKLYERSAVVAKQHGYTADYLGQLSRDGKVDAELVGRSWYVHSPSVTAYKASLHEDESISSDRDTDRSGQDEVYQVAIHTATAEVDKTRAVQSKSEHGSVRHIHPGKDEKASKISISRPNQMTDAPVRSSQSRAASAPSLARAAIDPAVAPYESYARWRRASYEPDGAELVPSVQKSTPAKTRPPVTAFTAPDTHVIRVHSDTDQYSIVASEIPSVRLRGKISLQGVDHDTEAAGYEAADSVVRKKIADFQQPQPAAQTRRSHRAPLVQQSTAPVAVADEPEAVSTPDRSVMGRRVVYALMVFTALCLLIFPFLQTTVSTSAADQSGIRLVDPRVWWGSVWSKF